MGLHTTPGRLPHREAMRLVVACLVAIADAVMRIRTCDVPSLLCLSYSGLADGPGGVFGFEVGS